MNAQGIVQGGVVIFSGDSGFPDGTAVQVVPLPAQVTNDDVASPNVWQRLAALARQAELEPSDLPTDLAANHDHYLHGLPKRQ